MFPSIFSDSEELLDCLLIHAHGIVGGELISGHALVNIARPTRARNICNARERCAVGSKGRSAMKGDGASATALEVVPSINTLVRLLNELRTPKDTTGCVTLIAQSFPLPFVSVTLIWGLAGAALRRPARSPALLVGRFADTLVALAGVTVPASEITRVGVGANRFRVIRIFAVVSPTHHLIGDEVRDLGTADNQRSRAKNNVGLDERGNP